MAKKLPFGEIAAAALARANHLVPQWLPGGNLVGHEYKALNPNRSDKKIGSFSINLNTGRWGDFADHNAQGGDLVSLYAYLFFGGDNGEAAYDLAELFGITMPPRGEDYVAKERKPLPAAPVAPVKNKPEKKPWIPQLPVPDIAPARPAAHEFRGLPERSWCYRSADGRVLGYVDRFITSDGGKETIPLTWCQQEGTGAMKWRNVSFPDPRPLYGLDRLAAKPGATVVVVEGEKCADAGDAELPDLVLVSWPGGSKAVSKADWAVLAGRKVIFWADCDAQRERLTKDEAAAGVDPASKPLLPANKQPGIMAMAKAAEIVQALEGTKVWMMDIPEPGEKPSGWDIADAIDEGLRGAELAAYIKEHAKLLRKPAADDLNATETPPDATAATAEEGDRGEGDESVGWRYKYLPVEARRQLLRNSSGNLIDCRENVYTFLMRDERVSEAWAIDEFARNVVAMKKLPWDGSEVGRPWQENDNLRLGFWLSQSYGLVVKNELTLQRAVSWVAEGFSFHPVRDYLDGLQWDGIPRIDSWLTDFLGVKDSEYSRLSGRLFLIAMVARIYKPGCLMRSMPILEGQQYKGKSTVLRILGGEWFSDATFDLKNKDTYQLIQGVWLHEVAELDAFSRAESTAMKAFVSSSEDRFRAPYEREPKDWPRQVCFAGTTNQDTYFKDTTGNTRYWPWKTGEVDEINHDGLRSVRDQLFAEAVSLFKAGERWHPTNEEQDRLFTPQQSDREIEEPWETIIGRHLRNGSFNTITTTTLLIEALKVEVSKIDGNRQMSTRVGNIMKRVGWIKKRETTGAREWFYEMPKDWREPEKAEDGFRVGF